MELTSGRIYIYRRKPTLARRGFAGNAYGWPCLRQDGPACVQHPEPQVCPHVVTTVLQMLLPPVVATVQLMSLYEALLPHARLLVRLFPAEPVSDT